MAGREGRVGRGDGRDGREGGEMEEVRADILLFVVRFENKVNRIWLNADVCSPF